MSLGNKPPAWQGYMYLPERLKTRKKGVILPGNAAALQWHYRVSKRINCRKQEQEGMVNTAVAP